MGLVVVETAETELLGEMRVAAVALLQRVEQVQLAGVWQVAPQNGFPE